jgi:DNA repair protein RadC
MPLYYIYIYVNTLVMKEYSNKLSIKQWAEDDRPREKLLGKGRLALSNAE